jgi:Flp pilus assembly protein TadB
MKDGDNGPGKNTYAGADIMSLRAIAAMCLTFAVAGGIRYLGHPLWLALICGLAVGILIPAILQVYIMRRRR